MKKFSNIKKIKETRNLNLIKIDEKKLDRILFLLEKTYRPRNVTAVAVIVDLISVLIQNLIKFIIIGVLLYFLDWSSLFKLINLYLNIDIISDFKEFISAYEPDFKDEQSKEPTSFRAFRSFSP